MKTIHTNKQGWDIHSPTADAIKKCATSLDSFKNLVYEIKDCVRTSSVADIKSDMLFLASNLKEYAEQMDENVHFVTIGKEDEARYFRYLNEYLDIDELCEKEGMDTQQALNWVKTMQKLYVVEDIAKR